MAEKKTILLTGGNSGIGLEACKILCSEGHKVVATVRSDDKGNHCLQEVEKYFPGADIHYMICDTSDPSSIRQLVEQFKTKHLAEEKYLDILINNAGIYPPDTDDRIMCSHHPHWENTIATNCFGPVLLADLLKDDLKRAAQEKGTESIILMVSSAAIIADKVPGLAPYQTRMDDIMMDTTYKKGTSMAYKNSKVCLTLASVGLAEELAESNVAVHIMCPGMIPGTEIFRHAIPHQRRLLNFGLNCCCCVVQPQPVHQGGMYIADIATHGVGKGTSGKFWMRGKLTDLPAQCLVRSKYSQMLEICRKETSIP